METALLSALRQWLAAYSVSSKALSDTAQERQALENALQSLNSEIAAIEAQRDRAFELVETGVYTPERFRERQSILAERRGRAIASASETRQALDRLLREERFRQTLLPRVSSVIQAYESTGCAQDKNDMLRSIAPKIIYSKTTSTRSPSGSDLVLTIYPIIPDRRS